MANQSKFARKLLHAVAAVIVLLTAGDQSTDLSAFTDHRPIRPIARFRPNMYYLRSVKH